MLAAALWAALVGSLILTPIAFLFRSWVWLLTAAVLSLVFSIAALFSIGPAVVLLTCLQLAGAVAFRWSFGWRGWAGLMLLGATVWAIAVPGQISLGREIPVIVVLPLALLAALIALVVRHGQDSTRR